MYSVKDVSTFGFISYMIIKFFNLFLINKLNNIINDLKMDFIEEIKSGTKLQNVYFSYVD